MQEKWKEPEPNLGSPRTRTEPNSSNEGSFPSLVFSALSALADKIMGDITSDVYGVNWQAWSVQD